MLSSYRSVNQIAQDVVTELRSLIVDLGKNGGMMSPSVYDTAQVLRYRPPANTLPVVQWLVARQQADGGWGDPLIPIARIVPSLATILALQPFKREEGVRQAIKAGERWLDQAGENWPATLPDYMPVGIELLLQLLLTDAALAGIRISAQPYVALLAIGERRRQRLISLPLQAGTTAAHSWEAWGTVPDPALMDGIGSIGHSPAATAAWIHAAQGQHDLADASAKAERYLAQAARSTGLGIPGVVPTAWPIARFEQCTALYALLLADLLHHPQLRSVIVPQIVDLNRAIQPTGIGFTDWFEPDGDDTAMALAVVRAGGQPRTLAALEYFATGDHWCAYQGELQPAASVTAHGLHALSIFGETRPTAAEAYLIERQCPDGRWISDKWSASWVYTTSHALFALQHTAGNRAVQHATQALLNGQSMSGGWGGQRVCSEETAYALIALNKLARHTPLGAAGDRARERARQWVISHYRPNEPVLSACWQAKEIYRPYRIARTYELAAVLQSIELAPSFPASRWRSTWIATIS